VADVTFSEVGKVYGDGTRAVRGLNLKIADGEFMVFVGPSGCGKTTALRMLAGLEEITEGEIRIGERVVNTLEPRQRDVAMVFQNYALYPQMTVFDNMAFGLRMRKTPKAEIKRRVEEIARVLDLSDLLRRKPATLSGGQRQRVAMGRAIVRQPQAFLMDEPLSNLDAKLRVQMRAEIARIQREVGATTIYVTHDQIEAMTMGHRVAVMRKGILQQVDVPQELYDHPTNLFVAGFIGSPAMNFVQARLEPNGSGLRCCIGAQDLPIPDAVVAARPVLRDYIGKTVALGIRPEHLRDPGTAPSSFVGRVNGRVRATELLGSEVLAHLDIEAPPVVSSEMLEIAADVDASAAHELRHVEAEQRAIFVGEFDRSAPIEVGQPVECAVATANMHFFDLETGAALANRSD
jgi:multiple sugar transport system ATP-binding protein